MDNSTELAQREMAQREKFEAWVEADGALRWGYLKQYRNSYGSYSVSDYACMWDAWKAATAEMVEALEATDKTSAARKEAIERTHKMFQRERDRAEAAEKRIAELQSDVIAPGIMRCSGCGFVLTKNSINMAAGTITAGDCKTEPCPNGCGPLWLVTWKEQALQMRDDSESWFLELQDAKKRIAELEVKVAKPVSLPKTNGYWNEQEKAFEEGITLAKRRIRLAGFRCEEDE